MRNMRKVKIYKEINDKESIEDCSWCPGGVQEDKGAFGVIEPVNDTFATDTLTLRLFRRLIAVSQKKKKKSIIELLFD